MKSRMGKLTALLWAVVLVLSVFGCTKEKAKGDDKIVIGVSFDSLISPVWVANLDAINRTAAKYGAEVVTMMAEGDAAKQNQQIENLLAQGVDAIICGPKDSGAILASVSKCKEAKVPIIMDNRSVSGDVLPEAQIVADNRAMAQAELEQFGEIARAEGKSYNAILLIGSLADENAVVRKQGHDAAIAKYSDVYNIVAEVSSDWNLETALKGLQNALQANPNVDMIITPSDFLWPPIRSSLEQIGKWGKIGEQNHVAVLSFDGDEVGLQYMKDGYSEANAVQDVVLEGELCVEWAIKIINGEMPKQNIIYDPGVILTTKNFNELAPTVWSYSLLK